MTQLSPTAIHYANGTGAAVSVYYSSDGEKLSTSVGNLSSSFSDPFDVGCVCFAVASSGR